MKPLNPKSSARGCKAASRDAAVQCFGLMTRQNGKATKSCSAGTSTLLEMLDNSVDDNKHTTAFGVRGSMTTTSADRCSKCCSDHLVSTSSEQQLREHETRSALTGQGSWCTKPRPTTVPEPTISFLHCPVPLGDAARTPNMTCVSRIACRDTLQSGAWW